MDRTTKLLEAAYGAPCAGKGVFKFSPAIAKVGDLPAGLVTTLPHLPWEQSPLAMVCVGSACRPSVRNPEALAEALESA
ncbi:MAG TPA: hypothetical protein VM182_09890 [Terriglobia bacterium]|nr:hypothetical protein [Terriglobia bacterium]